MGIFYRRGRKKICISAKMVVTLHSQTTPRGGAVVARWAHNPKVAGSSPAPATKNEAVSN